MVAPHDENYLNETCLDMLFHRIDDFAFGGDGAVTHTAATRSTHQGHGGREARHVCIP